MSKFSVIAAAVLFGACSALAQTGDSGAKFKRTDSNATESVKLDMVSVTASNKMASSARLRFFQIKFQAFAWITTC